MIHSFPSFCLVSPIRLGAPVLYILFTSLRAASIILLLRKYYQQVYNKHVYNILAPLAVFLPNCFCVQISLGCAYI